MAEKLLNYVDGGWREAAAERYLDVPNPATAEVLATVPLSPVSEVDEAARIAAEAFPAWRRTPAPARIQYLFKLKMLMEEHFEDLSRSDHAGKRQGAGRRPRRDAPRHRERGSGVRHPHDDAGRLRRGRGARGGRIHDPPAGGRGRHHLPLQLSGHDPLLVSALCAGLRQHGDRQALRALPDHAAKGLPPARPGGLPQGRGQPGQRRRRHGQRAARSPGDLGRDLCRFDAGGAPCLQPRFGLRQARAGAGRGQEPDHPAARRRRGTDDQHRGRQRLWQRRPALPGRLAGHHRGRRRQDLRAGAGRDMPARAWWATGWSRAYTWGR